jgi:hypothetical protein
VVVFLSGMRAMAKSTTIIVRVDSDAKARIEAAAGRLGKSITTFILDAAEQATRKVESMPTTIQKPKGRGVCPTFFVACCHEAARGGTNGYAAAGRTLARHLHALAPYEMEEAEWEEELRRLEDRLYPPREGGLLAIFNPDDEQVWEWFTRNLPRCTALVPRRRREQFLAGVYEAVEKGDVEF